VDALVAILDGTTPGSVGVVVGRPGAGVSRTLGSLCDAAVTDGIRAVLVCWERAPERWAGVVENGAVRTPVVVGWDTSTLARWSADEGVGPGALVAIDYLGLVSPDQVASAEALAALARERRWRLLLGIMAPRSLERLRGTPRASEADEVIRGALSGVLIHADRVVALTGAGPLLLSA
jgi:hypothetical protein